MIGCLDQSLGNIGASIISGVNGTLIGAGTGLGGIINGRQCVRHFRSISGIFLESGTNSILSGSAIGAGAAVGGIASNGELSSAYIKV